MKNLQEALQFIKSRCPAKPQVGVILGSGLGHFIQTLDVIHTIPFAEIPHFVPTTVEGHSGNLIFANLDGKVIVGLQGRLHYYEGHSMETVTFPTRVMALLGIETLVITNSAGGLSDKMQPGDFMIIEDHINMMGTNPLMGPNIKELGPRFPDMTHAYDRNLNLILESVFQGQGIRYHRGIYGGVSGPTYETPAEVRFLRMIGCSAVGMSTVPETIAANHLGLRVVALSCITNLAAGILDKKLSHEEVTETAKRVEKDFAHSLKTFIGKI